MGSPRTLALLVLIGVTGALVAVWLGEGGPEETPPLPAPAPEGAVPRAAPRRELPQLRGRDESARLPVAPAEDLWAMVPTEAGLRQLQEDEFRQGGGFNIPGTDRDAARAAVNEEGWADRFEAELQRGLDERVLVGGATVTQLECVRGRCLLELQYESMNTALERIEVVRDWLGRGQCHAYSAGPDDVDIPSALPTQQIWILCGEPTDS